MEITINFWVVLGAAIASMVVGSLWYSPLMFAKPWMRLSGLTEERMNQAKARGMGGLYITQFVASLVMSYVLYHFIFLWDVAGLTELWQMVFWLWLGFIATVLLGSVLWEGRPIRLYLINSLYWLVNIFVMAGIITLFVR